MIRRIYAFAAVAAFGAALGAVFGASQANAQNIRIAYIDPLSGPFASVGENGLRIFEFAADRVNQRGGVLGGRRIEIVPFDNQINPKESLIQLKRAIGQGIRFIAQGNSSGVANALVDAVDKHNRRNPDSRVVFINYSAVDPVLTNDKCSFWHFRLDANADIKMDALTDFIARDSSIRRIYIIGQDYSFGRAVAAAAVRFLKEKRPDIRIVGNELHPIGKVKDFTPYATKIKSARPDAIITGNWGADMIGIGKAVIEAGLRVPVFTYYAAYNGITKTFGADGDGVLRLVSIDAPNPPTAELAEVERSFRAKYTNLDVNQLRAYTAVEVLAAAFKKAGTDDPTAVAYALEGLVLTSASGSAVYIRPEDHQAIQDVSILVHTRGPDIEIDADRSGYGLLQEGRVAMAGLNSPTTCDMESKRPRF